jgi:predicted transcriptional regulator
MKPPIQCLRERGELPYVQRMSAAELIAQFKSLPASERAQVAKFVVENDDSWIPKSFREGMTDAQAGRFVDLDTALNEPYSEEA